MILHDVTKPILSKQIPNETFDGHEHLQHWPLKEHWYYGRLLILQQTPGAIIGLAIQSRKEGACYKLSSLDQLSRPSDADLHCGRHVHMPRSMVSEMKNSFSLGSLWNEKFEETVSIRLWLLFFDLADMFDRHILALLQERSIWHAFLWVSNRLVEHERYPFCF